MAGAVALIALAVGGCARPLNRPHPRTVTLDHLAIQACTNQHAELREWPAVRATVHAPRDAVFASIGEVLAAQGFEVVVSDPVLGCTQTAFEAVRPRRFENVYRLLTVHPPFRARSFVVQLEPWGEAVRLSVWGIAQFGATELTAGHSRLSREARRLARAIAARHRRQR